MFEKFQEMESLPLESPQWGVMSIQGKPGNTKGKKVQRCKQEKGDENKDTEVLKFKFQLY